MANKPSKYPWMKFFPSDWIKDPTLSICSPQTRGIWIDMICAMHESDRSGEISYSYQQLSRLCRCSIDEIESAVNELLESKTADVTIDNGNVTLINRRMKREYKERVSSRQRQRTHRRKKQNNNHVTLQKSYIRKHRSEDCPTDIASQSPKVSVNKDTLLDQFSRKFKDNYGCEYHASYAKDSKLLKNLEKQYGKKAVEDGIQYFFDVFIKENDFASKKPDVGTLSMMWNAMVASSKSTNNELSAIKEWVNENI